MSLQFDFEKMMNNLTHLNNFFRNSNTANIEMDKENKAPTNTTPGEHLMNNNQV